MTKPASTKYSAGTGPDWMDSPPQSKSDSRASPGIAVKLNWIGSSTKSDRTAAKIFQALTSKFKRTMTVHHSVILSFDVPLSETEKSSILAAASALRERIPCIRSFTCGFDLGLSGRKDQDLAIYATFETPDTFKIYQTHPDHIAFLNDHIKPRLAENGRKACQFESP